MDFSISLLENQFYIFEKAANVSVYDYDFSLFHNCTHPNHLDAKRPGILRIGAIADYRKTYEQILAMGVELINTPEQHALASELIEWYPVLKEFTPKSVWFDKFPSYDELSRVLGAKLFLKGSRQTSKHDASLCIVSNEKEYVEIQDKFQKNSILGWQTIVAREFIELKPVWGNIAGKVPPKSEFRSFWFKKKLVGFGRYWYQVEPYDLSEKQKEAAIDFCQKIVDRMEVPFLVLDIALTIDDDWILVECNDAQESGYAAIDVKSIWKAITSDDTTAI